MTEAIRGMTCDIVQHFASRGTKGLKHSPGEASFCDLASACDELTTKTSGAQGLSTKKSAYPAPHTQDGPPLKLFADSTCRPLLENESRRTERADVQGMYEFSLKKESGELSTVIISATEKEEEEEEIGMATFSEGIWSPLWKTKRNPPYHAQMLQQIHAALFSLLARPSPTETANFSLHHALSAYNRRSTAIHM